jgi:hypothetical protein
MISFITSDGALVLVSEAALLSKSVQCYLNY